MQNPTFQRTRDIVMKCVPTPCRKSRVALITHNAQFAKNKLDQHQQQITTKINKKQKTKRTNGLNLTQFRSDFTKPPRSLFVLSSTRNRRHIPLKVNSSGNAHSAILLRSTEKRFGRKDAVLKKCRSYSAIYSATVQSICCRKPCTVEKRRPQRKCRTANRLL